MGVFSRIKSILDTHGYPVEMDEYGGGEERYFVVMIETRPANFADNKPRHERYSVMVHLVAPKSDDISTIEDQVKSALLAAGFSFPSVVPAGDSERWRQIYEFECVEVV